MEVVMRNASEFNAEGKKKRILIKDMEILGGKTCEGRFKLEGC